MAAILAAAIGASPVSEVADLRRHAEAAVQARTLYLTLYAVPPERRLEVKLCVDYVLNATNRRGRAILRTEHLTETILALSPALFPRPDFDDKIGAWVRLGQRDPYFHLATEVLVDGKPKKVVVNAPWAGLENIERFNGYAILSAPILRADWFVAQVSAAPAYYEFAGIPEREKDFLQQLGLEPKEIEQLRANLGANLLQSGVTQKPRRVVWAQGPLGGVYVTHDVEQVDAARDPLRRPISTDGIGFRFDANEYFAMGANGLWKTALYGSDGKRQDSVPERIAKDTTEPAGDGRVVPLISCIRCHVEGGLRPFTDDQQSLLHGPAFLNSARPEVIERAIEFYDPERLNRQMEFDRATYTLAVKRVCDMTPAELAAAMARTVHEIQYAHVTPEVAAREIGVEPGQIPLLFAGTIDPILIRLAAGEHVLRGQWESSFAEAATRARASQKHE